VNAKLGWLNNVSGVCGVLGVFFLASYWSAKFGSFVSTTAFASHGTPTTGENYQLTQSEASAASQSALITGQ
jgi:hypothetical protein